ncbi:MAG: hypothetical protein L0212_10600 [Acidobacteria bacterium]|nr:hypothetical protein [Acidobacteriota bacterium]
MKNFQALTPVLFVDRIEPSRDFCQGLGFTVEREVREGEELAFVILRREDVQLMYQTYSSLRQDLPALAGQPYRSALFVVVADLEEVASRLPASAIVVPRRTTPYGATEIIVREPGGHYFIFAFFAARAKV